MLKIQYVNTPATPKTFTCAACGAAAPRASYYAAVGVRLTETPRRWCGHCGSAMLDQRVASLV